MSSSVTVQLALAQGEERRGFLVGARGPERKDASGLSLPSEALSRGRPREGSLVGSCSAGSRQELGSRGRRSRRTIGPAPIYAGVGARKTPAPVLGAMKDMATNLAGRGWHLRTGGAKGSDDAFARAAPVRAPDCLLALAWLQRLERDRGSRADGAGAPDAPDGSSAPPSGVAEVPGQGPGPARTQRGHSGRREHAGASARDGVLDRGWAGRGRHWHGDPSCQALPDPDP